VSTFHAPGNAATPRLAARPGGPLHRLVARVLEELRMLGREASEGQSAGTPVILVAGMAACMWTLAALMIALAVLAASLITG
jgi:hypothetical protein